MSNYEEIMRKRQEQFKKQNSYIKDNYKKLTTTLKMDIYNQVISKYNGTEIDGKKWSMNKYITNLILADLEKDKKPMDVPETTYIPSPAPKKIQPKPKQKKPVISDEDFEKWISTLDFTQAIEIPFALTDRQFATLGEMKRQCLNMDDDTPQDDFIVNSLKEMGMSKELIEQAKKPIEEKGNRKEKYIQDPHNPNKIISEDYYAHRSLESIVKGLPISEDTRKEIEKKK